MPAFSTPHAAAIAFFALLSLAGCSTNPELAAPSIPVAGEWKETPPLAMAAADTDPLPVEWWRVFNDPTLDALVAKALDANRDIAAAAARVAEARALAGLAKSDVLPHLIGDTAYTRSSQGRNRAGGPTSSAATDDFSTSLNLSYELDLWGRVRSTTNAAVADAEAAEADRDAVRVLVSAEVTTDYQLIRSLDEEARVIRATIVARTEALHLQRTRNQAGLINEMDVTRASTELANVEAELQSVFRARSQLEHALAVVCGESPTHFVIAERIAPAQLPSIPIGLPSSLLERRPDIARAAFSLEAAGSRVGAAKAAFFPTVTLTGSAGFASEDLGDLIESPSRFWGFGPSIHVPLFDGGRNEANLDAATARYEQARAAYESVVLNAFREVEDALSDIRTLDAQCGAVGRALDSSRDTARLAQERYQRGLTSYLDVVDAERAALQAERLDAQLRGRRVASTILLAKALGGGWEGGPRPVILSMQ